MSNASGRSSTVISNALRKTRTQLGPSSGLDSLESLLLSWVYPVEVLDHLLRSKAEQHVLAAAAAASSNKEQALEKSLRPDCGSKPASKWLKTTREPRCITKNTFGCISRHLALSTANIVSKNGRFWAVFDCFQDDRLESSGRSPLRQAGVSDEGRCSSMLIGLSKDGKWVFNKACTTTWCHAVVQVEVKVSCFPAAIQDHRRNHGGTSIKEAVFLQR